MASLVPFGCYRVRMGDRQPKDERLNLRLTAAMMRDITTEAERREVSMNQVAREWLAAGRKSLCEHPKETKQREGR